MARIYLGPRDGRLLRDYRTMQAVPDSGRWVPDISFWRRKLRGGDNSDAVLGTPPESDPATPGDLCATATKSKKSKPRS